MSNYVSGRNKEWWLRKELQEDPDCIECVRSAGSKGSFDLVAIMKDETWLIQVKGKNPISPAERKALESCSGNIIYRVCWVVFIYGDNTRWQMFCDGEVGTGMERGWFECPDGPWERKGKKVKLRGDKVV